MGALDLFQSDERAAMDYAARHSAPDLPATIGETFEPAWHAGRYFSQSIAGANARDAVVDDYIADVKRRTGTDISEQVYPSISPDQQNVKSYVDYEGAQAAVDKLKQKTGIDFAPFTQDEIDNRALTKSREAQRDYQAMSAREKTWGGSFGFFAGGMAAQMTDPINVAALAIAPESVGILGNALKWAGVGAASQLAIELASDEYKERVQPGYIESGAPLANVVETGLQAGGAALGLKVLGRAWGLVQNRLWPTSVRDAGNIVASEAQLQESNIYRGAEGDVAHRQAMAKAADDIMSGNPVDVGGIITPEIRAAAEERFDPLLQARERANTAWQAAQDAEKGATGRAPELPFAREGALAEYDKQIGAMADELQGIAKERGYEMPGADAETLAKQLAKASPEELADKLDALMTAPSAAAERAKGAAEVPPEPQPAAAKFEPERTPEQQQALRTGLDRERAKGDVIVHMDVDKDGNPITRSLDSLLGEVDADRAAAAHLEGCLNPAPELSKEAA